MRQSALLFALQLVLSAAVMGQTRTEELELLRQEHAKELVPEKTSRLEDMLRRFKEEKTLQKVNFGYNGLGAKLGGLVTGSGFAFGPQYVREDLWDGGLQVRASAQISLKAYGKVEGAMRLPKLAGGRVSLDLHSAYRNYPGIQYYGSGPDSNKTRTNYRLEDTAVDAAASISPMRFVKVGGGAGWLGVNVGPGTDSRFASTDQVFTPAQAPGIDRQTDFLRYGAFGQIDYTDDMYAPRQGGSYVVQYTRFEDRNLRLHDFNLLEVDLQQYFGFFNKSRVIAFRARTRMTDVAGGQTVPFYLQPTVGGSDDLRGFRPYRFAGNNSLLLNGEYRWAIFSGCDGALFVDGGKVFNRRGELNFNNLEGSAGFGLRFNARNRTFIRVDVGFSHEGFQVWFKFNDAFHSRPLGTADSQPLL